MAHKLSWLASVVAAAALAVVVTRLSSASSARSDGAELAARLRQLEGELPEMRRSLSRAGGQLGAAALTRTVTRPGLTAAPPEPPESEDEAASATERAEKERQHYERLDTLARGGAGGPVASSVRQNVQQAGSIRGNRSDLALEVVSLQCSESLCRVEVRAGKGRATVEEITRTLGHGMDAVTMRPRGDGQGGDVFYVAAAGKPLPLPEP